MNELLHPNILDQKAAIINQFDGMSREGFSYAEFEQTRKDLVETVLGSLTNRDRNFIVGVKNGDPDWDIYDLERCPAVQWKLRNILKLKTSDPQKHDAMLKELKRKLGLL